jgi:cytochrome c-type biogenesis protein CcmH
MMRRIASSARWLGPCVSLSVLIFALPVLSVAQDPVLGFEDPELDARFRKLTHEIRCMNCQNQSIAESPADQARDVRRIVWERMRDGQSDDEILDYLRSRYGDFISYMPAFKPSTWLLWFAPALFLLGGGLIFARIVRARMQQPLDEDIE